MGRTELIVKRNGKTIKHHMYVVVWLDDMEARCYTTYQETKIDVINEFADRHTGKIKGVYRIYDEDFYTGKS